MARENAGVDKKDYYQILEVHPKASQEMIKKAYSVLAKRYHPDMHPLGKKEWAHERFKELSEAYEVLSNPILRQEYDGSLRYPSPEEEKPLSEQEARQNEEAYFYYRQGMGYYIRTAKRGFFSNLSGKWERNLTRARHNFLKVMNSYPDSKFAENAHYYYLGTLLNSFDYSEEFQNKAEEESKAFLTRYPNSKWQENLHYQLARFYLIKRFKYHKALKALKKFVARYPEHELMDTVQILLAWTKEKSKKYCPSCDRKLKSKGAICPYCGERPLLGD